MPYERLAIIFVVISVIAFFLTQMVFPTIEGTSWFPMFRKKKVKGIPTEDDIRADIKEAVEASRATQLEKVLREQRQALEQSRTDLNPKTTSQPPPKTKE